MTTVMYLMISFCSMTNEAGCIDEMKYCVKHRFEKENINEAYKWCEFHYHD